MRHLALAVGGCADAGATGELTGFVPLGATFTVEAVQVPPSAKPSR